MCLFTLLLFNGTGRTQLVASSPIPFSFDDTLHCFLYDMLMPLGASLFVDFVPVASIFFLRLLRVCLCCRRSSCQSRWRRALCETFTCHLLCYFIDVRTLFTFQLSSQELLHFTTKTSRVVTGVFRCPPRFMPHLPVWSINSLPQSPTRPVSQPHPSINRTTPNLSLRNVAQGKPYNSLSDLV